MSIHWGLTISRNMDILWLIVNHKILYQVLRIEDKRTTSGGRGHEHALRLQPQISMAATPRLFCGTGIHALTIQTWK